MPDRLRSRPPWLSQVPAEHSWHALGPSPALRRNPLAFVWIGLGGVEQAITCRDSIRPSVNGLLNAIPWALAAVALISVPSRLRSDRSIFRFAAAVTLLGAVCFVASILLTDNTQRTLQILTPPADEMLNIFCVGGISAPLLRTSRF